MKAVSAKAHVDEEVVVARLKNLTLLVILYCVRATRATKRISGRIGVIRDNEKNVTPSKAT